MSENTLLVPALEVVMNIMDEDKVTAHEALVTFISVAVKEIDSAESSVEAYYVTIAYSYLQVLGTIFIPEKDIYKVVDEMRCILWEATSDASQGLFSYDYIDKLLKSQPYYVSPPQGEQGIC